MAEQVYKKDIDALKEDFQALRKDMGELLKTVSDVGKHRAGAVADKAQEELDRRLLQLNEAYQAVRKETGRYTQSFQSKVEENPLTSILIALGVGVVVGKLISKV